MDMKLLLPQKEENTVARHRSARLVGQYDRTRPRSTFDSLKSPPVSMADRTNDPRLLSPANRRPGRNATVSLWETLKNYHIEMPPGVI